MEVDVGIREAYAQIVHSVGTKFVRQYVHPSTLCRVHGVNWINFRAHRTDLGDDPSVSVPCNDVKLPTIDVDVAVGDDETM
jgi:hypothetical protein